MGQCMPKTSTSFISPQDGDARATEGDAVEKNSLAGVPGTNNHLLMSAYPNTDLQKLPLKVAHSKTKSQTSINQPFNISAVSTPSAIDNDHITKTYRLPSDHYKTSKEVLDAHNIRLLSKIDEGGFAKVYLAILNDQEVACKVIDLRQTNTDGTIDNNKLNDVKNELFVLQKVKHPHIVRLYEHFIIDNILYIFLQYANSGNLFQFMQLHGPMSENKSKKPFAQIVSGVAFMHAKHIAHRDLKLSNILLNSDTNNRFYILIADFGLSRVVYRRQRGIVLCESFCGTRNYMAPELKHHKRYNAFAIDIYALGVMLFLLLNCAYPFDDKDEKALLAMERNKPLLNWNPVVKVSEQLITLINWMLQPVVSHRMTMPELIKAEWFRAEMDELKHCLPPPEAFDKMQQHQSQQRLSSPENDVRLKSLTRQHSPAFSSFKHKKKIMSRDNLNNGKIKKGSTCNFTSDTHKHKERLKSQSKIIEDHSKFKRKKPKETIHHVSKQALQTYKKEARGTHGKGK